MQEDEEPEPDCDRLDDVDDGKIEPGEFEQDAFEEDTDGSTVEFTATAQVSTPAAVRYVENGGIFNLVLCRLLTQE